MKTDRIIRAQAHTLSSFWQGAVKGSVADDYAQFVQSCIGEEITVDIPTGLPRNFLRITEIITGRRASAIIRKGPNACYE